MRNFLKIFILFFVVSCTKEESKDNSIQTSEKQIIDTVSNKGETHDSLIVDQFIFGRYCGECAGRCAPMFSFNTKGNSIRLWGDLDDNYWKGREHFQFKTDMNKEKYFSIANEILKKLPMQLRNEKENDKKFGCPDCRDQCGIYIEIYNMDTKVRKKFRLDVDKNEAVPKEITDYANFVSEKINELLK